MPDIDLIPSDYRAGLRLRRSAHRFVVVLVLLLAASLLINITLGRATAEVRNTVDVLQARQTISVEQRERLNQLNERKQRDESQLQMLEGLRGGIEAQTMFVAVDRALVDNQVWFTHWDFQRAGTVVEHNVEVVNTGYFVILPKDDDQPATEAWKIETHMSIRGEATDYTALSGFVSRLLVQPEIESVHVQNTATRSRGGRQSVEFTLAVVVNTGAGVRS